MDRGGKDVKGLAGISENVSRRNNGSNIILNWIKMKGEKGGKDFKCICNRSNSY